MRAFWTVLCREVVERRLLLLAAAFVGLFPFALPFLPGLAGRNAAELRAGTALALALIFAAVLAFTLGATVIAGELAERRLGFYFARPLPGWAIWAGKLAGAAVLCAGAVLLVLLPTLLLDRTTVEIGTPWWVGGSLIRDLPSLWAALTVGAVFILLLAHVVSSMARSRSPWLLLDLGAAFAVTAVAWNVRLLLLRQAAFGAFVRGFAVFLAAAAAAALAASALQVTQGRTDPRRGHRLLSLVFWAGVGLAAAGLAGYARWVVSPVPADLTMIDAVFPAPAGSWIVLRGPAAGRADFLAEFFFDTASGRFFRTGSASFYRRWWLRPAFSPEGSRAAWVDASSGGLELAIVDLGPSGARTVSSRIPLGDWPPFLALAPGGQRIAILDDSRLTVEDLATGRLLAAVPLTTVQDGSYLLHFADAEHLRLLQAPASPEGGEIRRLTVQDIDLRSGRVMATKAVEIPSTAVVLQMSSDGGRVVLRSSDRILLLDLRTGITVADLPREGEPGSVIFLADGRLVVNERTLDSAQLRLLSSEGAELRRFPFPGSRLAFGGEVTPGRLALAKTVRGIYGSPEGWTAFLLDVGSGRTSLLGRGLLPVSRGPTAGPASAGPRLFLRSGGDLVLLDPATGRFRTLLHPRRPAG